MKTKLSEKNSSCWSNENPSWQKWHENVQPSFQEWENVFLETILVKSFKLCSCPWKKTGGLVVRPQGGLGFKCPDGIITFHSPSPGALAGANDYGWIDDSDKAILEEENYCMAMVVVQ